MSSTAPRAMHRSRNWLAVGLICAAAFAGCSGDRSGGEASARKQASNGDAAAAHNFDKNRDFQVRPVAKFAGRITVDGQPPKKDGKLFVILTDPNHLEENALGQLPKLYAVCDADGRFAFGTYDLKNRNDGVFVGKYVVTFVQLHKFPPAPPKAGRRGGPAPADGARGREKYALPDDLENLYSDPDRNSKESKFNLDLQPPGKDDYQFDLTVAGKAAVKPAPHAVTYMVLVP
jgi:hypothetical protein